MQDVINEHMCCSCSAVWGITATLKQAFRSKVSDLKLSLEPQMFSRFMSPLTRSYDPKHKPHLLLGKCYTTFMENTLIARYVSSFSCAAFKCRKTPHLSVWILMFLPKEMLDISQLSGSDYSEIPGLFCIITLVICAGLFVCVDVFVQIHHYTSLGRHCTAAIRRVPQPSLLDEWLSARQDALPSRPGLTPRLLQNIYINITSFYISLA